MEKVLQGLGITYDQFIDLCILLGCDYCGNIKGIGPKKSVELIKQYGSIEEILQNIDHKVWEIFFYFLNFYFRNFHHQQDGSTKKQEVFFCSQM